jgi:N utilization substance protein B
MSSKMSEISRKGWAKVALILLVMTVLRTMVQPLIPESGPSPFPPSLFVDKGLMPVAFVIYGIVMLGLLAIVFLLIQDRLPGSRLVKGLTFGLSFGLLWFVYLCEPLPHGSWTLPDVLYYPIIDGTTVALFGILMGTWNPQGCRVESFKVPTAEELAVRTFADKLIRGTIEHREEADQRIRQYAQNWDLHRMAVVDRNILRMAIYEMLHREDIPPIVSINEAVDIAKKFSTQESGKFVNGLLDKVKSDILRPARIVKE